MQPTNEALAEKLVVIEDLLREHIAGSTAWRQRTDDELRRNTEVTEQIREASTALGWIKRVIVWVGGLAVGLAGIVGLWQALSGGGGIGPTP